MVNVPAGYGDLPQLARVALQPRTELVESRLKLRQTRPFRQDIRKSDPPPVKENPRYSEADVLRLQSRLQSSETRLVVAERGGESFRLPMSRSGDRSSLSAVELNGLRSLQLEIRSLRKDISNISLALVRIGVLPPLAPEGSHSTEAALIRRQGFSSDGNQKLNTQIRRQESAKINGRQRMLLSALRRVERKLSGAAQDTKAASEHGKIIGDIYKVRFAIASFQGPSTVSMLGGMLFDSAA